MKKPKWLSAIDEEKPVRKKADKQESNLAKQFKGRKTSNSGAALGQNDVLTDAFEIEAKTTTKSSYSIRITDLKKMHKKCASDKFPVLVVNFEGINKSYAVVSLDDFTFLTEK
jgi:hypothetical protein